MLPADAGGAEHPVDPQLRVQIQQLLLQQQDIYLWHAYIVLKVRFAIAILNARRYKLPFKSLHLRNLKDKRILNFSVKVIISLAQ